MEFKLVDGIISLDLGTFIPSKNDPFSYEYGCYLKDELVGYINFSIIYDRAELNYICVKEEYQNKGVGKEIMNFFIKQCNVSNITLEVNINNLKAIKLYEKYGFKKVSIRKNYYDGEDAMLMMKEMM